MRLRPLTEAECYARCYGERSDDAVRIVRAEPRADDEETWLELEEDRRDPHEEEAA